MVNRSDILVIGSVGELLDQPSEIFGNRSNFLMNGSLDGHMFQQSKLFDTLNRIQMYSNIVLIPVGFIFNNLCLVTFIKSKISQSPTGLTLTYLAVADNIVLVSMSIAFDSENWSKYLGIPSPVTKYTLICQGGMFLLNVGFLLSGLLLTSATIERYVSVRFALKVKSWNLYVKTKILLVVYFIAAFGLSSFSFLCYDIILWDIDRCLPSPRYEQFCYLSEIVCNSVLSNGLCTLLIFIFTILTSIELLKMKRKRSEMGKDSTKEFGITVMLVTVATLFMILRAPEMISFHTINYFITYNISGPVLDNAVTVYQLFVILVTVNHSINFIVYMIFLKQFRNTFLSFFIYVKLKCIESTEFD